MTTLKRWLGCAVRAAADVHDGMVTFTLDGLQARQYVSARHDKPWLAAGRVYNCAAPLPPALPRHIVESYVDARSALREYATGLERGLGPASAHPRAWELVRTHAVRCDAGETWYVGSLLNAVGATGEDLFVALVAGATPCGMGWLDDGGAPDSASSLRAAFRAATRTDGAPYFDYYHGHAVKAWFPAEGPFPVDYNLRAGSYNRRHEDEAGACFARVGALVAQHLSRGAPPIRAPWLGAAATIAGARWARRVWK